MNFLIEFNSNVSHSNKNYAAKPPRTTAQMTRNVIVQNVWFSTLAEAERLLAVNDGILWDSFHVS